MQPLRRYGAKTKVGLTRGKRSGSTRSRGKDPQVEVNQGSKLWLTSNALAARFTSRNLLASSWLLCHDAINFSNPNRIPVYHGTHSSLRTASVQTSLSTPKVRRSVGAEPCRAPNSLKSSLKLFCQCCTAGRGPGLPPPRVSRRTTAASGVACPPIWPKPLRTEAVAGELSLPHFGSRFP